MAEQNISARKADVAGRMLAEYAELIRRDQAWSEADEQRVLELGRALGKSLEQMGQDRKVVAVARRLREVVEADVDLSAPRQAAREALREHDEQTKRIIEDRRAAYTRLWLAESELNQRALRRMKARSQLESLRREYPAFIA